MNKKLLLTLGMLLFFVSCSEKEYRSMYESEYELFDAKPNTILDRNYQKSRDIENRRNPFKRPTYDEYRQQ